MAEESFAESLRSEPVAALRSLRRELREEERRVSYWRRLVQGRLDQIRTALAGDQPGAERPAAGRSARKRTDQRQRRSPSFTRLSGLGMSRPLASLTEVWDGPIPWEDLDQLRQLEGTLATIEQELSNGRHSLHERIDACTAELVGRYRRDPGELDSLDPTRNGIT